MIVLLHVSLSTKIVSGKDVDLPECKVFIVSWVDYCNKYGMGYALTDGSVGVHFNDSTSIVLAANKQCVHNPGLTLLCVNIWSVATWITLPPGVVALPTPGRASLLQSIQKT